MSVKRSRSDYNGMDNSAIFDRYYNLSLRYLSYRQRSEKEIYDYLKQKSYRKPELTEDIITEIIQKLKEYSFLDDEKFAKAWIAERRRVKNKPTRVIKFELRQKGISDEVIDELLSSEDSKDQDLESAIKLASKKMDFYRNIEEKKRKEKVMSYLIRKGFSYDTAKKALND